jgi:hypothetical protein
LGLQEGKTRDNFGAIGFSIPWGPALDDVGYVHLGPFQSHRLDHPREQLTCLSHKRSSFPILIRTRPFSDEHERGLRIAFPKDDVFAPLMKKTARAFTEFLSDRFQTFLSVPCLRTNRKQDFSHPRAHLELKIGTGLLNPVV